MATVTVATNKKVLIVEDMHEVRKNLQMSLSTLGFLKLHTASSVKAALELMLSNKYDIILCDYYLGEDGPTGQQFLEYLRKKEKLKQGNLFFMLTAESGYKSVVAAAEFQPDDYMLKPFTAGAFMQRLERLTAAQEELADVNEAFRKKRWDVVIRETDKIIVKKNKNYFEALKLKASALFNAERFQESSEVYELILDTREVPWAELGLAKCKASLGQPEAARKICVKIMNEHPHHLQTVDFYSELMTSINKYDEAKEALIKAASLSPDNLSRARLLSSMAIANGDAAAAEETMKNAIKKQKHSLVKSALDYAVLAKTMTAQNKVEEALAVIDNAKKDFDDHHSVALLAAASSMAFIKAGMKSQAEEEIKIAMSVDATTLPHEMSSAFAEAFLATGNEDKAEKLIKQMVQRFPDSLSIKSQVKVAYSSAGKTAEEADAFIETSNDEIKTINNEAISQVKLKKFAESAKLVIDGNTRNPNNVDLMSHGAMILALALQHKAIDPKYINLCVEYRNGVMSNNPAHAKLPAIDAAIKKLGIEL